MRAATVVKVLAWLAVAAAIAAVAVLLNMDFSGYKREVAQAIRDATGRAVAIDGEFRLSPGLTPALAAGGIRLANAPWGSRPQMLTAQRIEVEVALLPLLLGDVVVRRLVLVRPDVMLETDARGRRNWDFGKGETVGGGDAGAPSVPAIASLRIDDGKVSFLGATVIEPVTATIDRLALDGADGTVRLRLIGALNGRRVSAQGSFGSLAALNRSAAPWPFDVAGRFAGATVTAKGHIRDPAALAGIDLRVEAAGGDLSALASLVEVDGLPPGPYRVRSHVADEAGGWKFSEIGATAPGLEFTATASVGPANESRRIRASVAAKLVDVDAWTVDRSDGPATVAGKRGSARVFADTPIPFAALAGWDAEIAIDIERLRAAGVEARSARLRLVARDRVIDLSEVTAKVAGGALSGSARIGARRTMAELDFDRVDFGRLATALGARDVVESIGDLKLALRGAGRSPRRIAAGLFGRVDLVLGKGKIYSRPLRLLGADLVQSLAPWASTEDDDVLNCMVARFAIAKGKARSEGLLLDTGTVTLAGEGTIDLASEALDLKIVPHPKEARLLSIATPIKVTGTLADVELAPDRLSVAKGVAGAVLGGLINPVGILVPLISLGSGDKNPCVAALAARTATGRAADQKSGGSGIQRTLEDVGRDITKELEGVFGK